MNSDFLCVACLCVACLCVLCDSVVNPAEPTGTDMSAKAHEGYEIAGANEPLHTRFAEPLPRIPLVWGPTDFEKLSEQISEITEKGQPAWWWLVSAE